MLVRWLRRNEMVSNGKNSAIGTFSSGLDSLVLATSQTATTRVLPVLAYTHCCLEVSSSSSSRSIHGFSLVPIRPFPAETCPRLRIDCQFHCLPRYLLQIAPTQQLVGEAKTGQRFSNVLFPRLRESGRHGDGIIEK